MTDEAPTGYSIVIQPSILATAPLDDGDPVIVGVDWGDALSSVVHDNDPEGYERAEAYPAINEWLTGIRDGITDRIVGSATFALAQFKDEAGRLAIMVTLPDGTVGYYDLLATSLNPDDPCTVALCHALDMEVPAP